MLHKRMKVAIKDTSIFIDMELTGLLDLWFNLGIETHTTDLIVSELNEKNPSAMAYIRSNQIICHTMAEEDMSELLSLKSRHGRQLSVADCSLLLVMDKISCAILLTGDAAVKKTAQEAGHETHGMLWIFNQLVDNQLLHPEIAITKLKFLCDNGSRLPKNECDACLAAWSQKSEKLR